MDRRPGSQRSGVRAAAAVVAVASVGVAVAASNGLAPAEPRSSDASTAPAEAPTRRVDGAATATAGAVTGTDILQAEIEALLAGGVAPDDPKVTRLREDLAALEAESSDPRAVEPGLDLSDALGTPPGGGARSMAAETDATTAWDQGAVDCEPLPADLLTVNELTGARCVMAPQPDGTGRYVAVTPDGTVHVVRFGPNGEVARETDRHIDPLGPALPRAELTVDSTGDVVVSVADAPAPTTIELG